MCVLLLCSSLSESRVTILSTGMITGTVSLPDSTLPGGIFVTVIGQNKTAVTDSLGNFSLPAVAAGPVRIQAGKLGYGNAVLDTVVPDAQTLTLFLQLASTIRDTESVIQTAAFSTSVANEGNLGAVNKFVDSNETGFTWGGIQELKEASLMIGIDSTRVSDAARFLLGIAQNNLDHDFQSLSDIVVRTSGPDSIVTITSFNDSRSNFPPGIPSQPLGIRITQESYAFPAQKDSGLLIVKLTLTNTTSLTLQNLLVGYFVDWDIQPAPNNNRGDVMKVQNQIIGVNGGQPFTTEIAVQRDATVGTRFMGVVPLSQPAFKAARIASVQQEIEPTGQNTGLTEANKYIYMRDRRIVNDTTDWGIEENLAMIVSLGDSNGGTYSASSFTLFPYASITVGFGFVGGNDSTQFITNALNAQKKWVELGNNLNIITGIDKRQSAVPKKFFLGQNYPNPFNPTTNFEFWLPGFRVVTIKIYNILGEEVGTLVNGLKAPGSYRVEWNAASMPSGMYFCRMIAGSFVETRKVLLIK